MAYIRRCRRLCLLIYLTTAPKALVVCARLIEERRSAARQAMQAAQEAANGEGKSSAGDKYETARAMAQADRDRAARQLAEADELAGQLARIASSPPTTGPIARPGHLIHTDKGSFLLGVGLGKVADNPPLFALSLGVPAAKILIGCKMGDMVALPGGTATVVGLK